MARRKKRRRTRRTKRRYRRNPVTLVGRRPRRKRRYRRNPAPVLGRRTSRKRRYRRNPSRLRGGLRKAFSRENMMAIGMTAIGFIGGIKAAKYINGIEALANMRKFTGAITFVLGSLIAFGGKARAGRGKKAIIGLGSGIAVSGIYDLLAQNIPQLLIAPVEGVDLDGDMFYGDDDYDMDGTAIDLDGTAIDLDGEDIEDLVGDDMDLDIVGDDGTPYEMV